jgi:hypothetical protein
MLTTAHNNATYGKASVTISIIGGADEPLHCEINNSEKRLSAVK